MTTRARPPAVLRTFVLTEIWRGRVRWMVPDGPALHHPRTGNRHPTDVTAQVTDLIRARLATLEPWDQNQPPASVACRTTGKGDDQLLTAQARRQRRSTRPRRPKPVRSAARRVTYRPVVLRELHAAGQWLRRHWPTDRRIRRWERRVGAAVRSWPGRVVAALRGWIVAERVGGHYRKHKPRRTRAKGGRG